MFDKTIVFIEVLIFAFKLIQTTDCVFVSVGDYTTHPNYKDFGINGELCGLRHEPLIVHIYRAPGCFIRNPGNFTFILSKEGLLPNNNDVRQRVAFGADAKYGEAPFTVYLETVRNSLTVNQCTGILVTLKWVLTAAHCFDKTDDQVEIHGGSNLKKGIERRIVYSNNWFTHSNYTYIRFNGTHNITAYRTQNDIALIKLDKPFHQSINETQYLINTICLPNSYDISTENDLATYFGFGRIGDNTRANHLQRGVANLRPFGDCPVTGGSSMFCTVETLGNVTKACEGDSGGPLLQYLDNGVKAVLVGVTQGFRPKNSKCTTSRLSLWTSVPFHINWILNTIIENNSND